MADDKKNIPDAGKVTEPPKQEQAEPIKASPHVTEQAAPIKPAPTVKESIPKDVPPPAKEDTPKEKVATAPTADKATPAAKEQPTPPEDAPAADKAPPVIKEQAAPPKEKPTPAVETKPPEKASPAGKVLDFAAVRDEGAKQAPTPKEKSPAEKTDKPGKTQEAAKPAKGRPPKADKAAPDKAQPPKPRDKVSQSKKDAPAKEETAAGGMTPGAEPAAEAPEEKAPARPIDEGKLVYLKLSELHAFHTFREHPFQVKDDDKMAELVGTIKEHGVMTPATVRPEKDGNGYEIIAGHRRHRGSELAGLEELPCIVRNMTDVEAVREMKNSNKQRGEPLPSELAKLLDLEVEAIKHQGGRLEGVAPGDVGKRSVEIVGENNGMNYKKVMRYIRLNSLVPELMDMVDNKKMGFMPAVELSYIKPKNQQLIAVSIEGEQSSPSHAQAKQLRELDQQGKLNGDVIDGILSEKKKTNY